MTCQSLDATARVNIPQLDGPIVRATGQQVAPAERHLQHSARMACESGEQGPRGTRPNLDRPVRRAGG